MGTADRHNGHSRLGVLCVAIAAAAALRGQESGGTIAGLVRDAARAPVAGADVAFHFAATAGVPGLRSDAERLETLRTTTDARGRFRLTAPDGVVGALTVAAGALAAAPRAGVVTGDLVSVALEAERRRSWRLRGLENLSIGVLYEGAFALPLHELPVAGDGLVAVREWPGLPIVLVAPPGFVEERSRCPWIAPGDAREAVFVRVPVRPGAGGWTGPAELRGVRTEAAWGEPLAGWVWIGQDAAGRAWLDDGLGVARTDGAGLRLRAATDDLVGAVLLHAVTFERRGTVHFASAAAAAGGAELAWSTAPAREPFLVVGQDRHGWILGPGANARPEDGELTWSRGAARLEGTVLDEAGRPLHGVRVFARPAAAVPERPGSRLGGIETATRSSGRFRLPARLADGDYELSAVADDGRWLRTSVTASAGALAAPTLLLPAGGVIEGRLFDAHGEPVHGALVQAWCGGEPLAIASLGLPVQRAFTRADGMFAIRGLRRGAMHEVWCETRGRGRALVNGVRPDGEALTLTLAVEPPRPR